MIRFLAPLAVVFAMATTANAQVTRRSTTSSTTAQTYRRSYTTTDGYGNSSTTTIEAPASVAGLIAGQTIYGGFPNYAGNFPAYGAPNCPPNYGYNAGYGNYNGNYPTNGYNGNYAGYGNNGYNGNYGYNAGYGNYNGNYAGYGNYNGNYNNYPPQAYYIPGQTVAIQRPSLGWVPSPTITSLPQVIVTPGAQYNPYNYGYGYPNPGYGYSSSTTVTSVGITAARGGLNVKAGVGTVRTR